VLLVTALLPRKLLLLLLLLLPRLLAILLPLLMLICGVVIDIADLMGLPKEAIGKLLL